MAEFIEFCKKGYVYGGKIIINTDDIVLVSEQEDGSVKLQLRPSCSYFTDRNGMLPVEGKYRDIAKKVLGDKYVPSWDERMNEKMYGDHTLKGVDGTSIGKLNLSNRAYNILDRAGIKTIEELSKYSERDLRKLRLAGNGVVSEILEKMENYRKEEVNNRGDQYSE